MQILYQSETRSVLRKTVRVWDFHPEMGLDFVWEPAAGQSPDRTVAADGTVNGKGRLVWRVRGSASYDPKTIYSSYFGEIRNGRPDGQGRLELRSGEVLDGHWVAGQLDGHAASMSMPTAIAMKGNSGPVCRMARAGWRRRQARYSSALLPTA